MHVPSMQIDPELFRLNNCWNLIRFFCLICALTIGPTGLIALAADADAASGDAGNPAVALEPGVEPVWHFTSYLKGTTSQVRQQINGEVERLMARTRATKKAIADYKAAIKADEKVSIDRLHNDGRYVQQKADLKQAEADLETARKTGTPQDRLDASARCNHLRASIEQTESDAMAKDQALTDDRDALKEQTAGLKRHTEALERRKNGVIRWLTRSKPPRASTGLSTPAVPACSGR